MKISSDGNHTERVCLAAEMYYKEKLGQKCIADRLNISQTSVSRLLHEAELGGLVEIKIHYPYLTQQGQKLKKYLPDIVKKVSIVANTHGVNGTGKNTEKLGLAGAEHLIGLLINSEKDTIKICISCGKTMKSLIDNLERIVAYNTGYINALKKKKIVLYPTVVQINYKVSKTSPSYLVTYFVGKMTKYFRTIDAYTPMVPKIFLETYYEKDEWNDLYNLALMPKPDICIFGIGLLNDENFESIIENFVVKIPPKDLSEIIEINHYPLNKDGDAIKEYLNNVIGMRVDLLRKLSLSDDCDVVAVAGSYQKAKAMMSCLKNPCFDTLITDTTVAEYAIDNLKEKN